jgi:hypothetical protein
MLKLVETFIYIGAVIAATGIAALFAHLFGWL